MSPYFVGCFSYVAQPSSLLLPHSHHSSNSTVYRIINLPRRYPALKESIEREQAAVWANLADDNKEAIKTGGSFGGRNTYGPLLVMLKADKQAVLVSNTRGKGRGTRRRWRRRLTVYVARGGVGRKGNEVATDSSHSWPCISVWLVETEVEVGRGCAWVRIGKAFSCNSLLWCSLFCWSTLTPQKLFTRVSFFLCLRL